MSDEDYSKHPKSITEIKADKAAENSGTIWKPRDALIKLLREIDEGLNVDSLVIAYRIATETRGIASLSYKQASPDNETSIGVLFRAAQMIARDGD